MGVTTDIDIESKIRMHKVTGALQRDELIAVLDKVYKTPGYDPDMDVVWDLREADLTSFSSEDIQAVRNFVGRKWGTGGKSRAALVVSRDVEFGLTRMYEVYLESDTKSQVHVFRDMDKAMEWIRSENDE
ncbi:MAG: hypothetical protein JSV33_16045 [bacterium]|nr:MAG: hypothetical protein JSV33_16045 [bacterium]